MSHKIQMYENLRDMLEREVKTIESKGDLNKESLENLYQLMSAIKHVDGCIMREEYAENDGTKYSFGRDGHSYNYSWNNGGMSNYYPYYYDGDYANDARHPVTMNRGTRPYSYDGESHDGRHGRDADNDGRYSERGDGGYSRDASRKKMVQKLETLMDDTMSENERKAIQECINKIGK